MVRTRGAEPRKLPRQRRAQETVARILAAAARIFEEAGYDGTTTNDVAAAARVSVGSLYQYFPNKDALLVALAERHVEDAVVALRAEVAATATLELDDVVRRLVELTVRLNDTEGLHALMHAEAVRTPALRARFERLVEVVVDGLTPVLVTAGHEPDAARRRARLLVAAVDAAVHDVVLAAPPGPARDALTVELVAMARGAVGPGGSR